MFRTDSPGYRIVLGEASGQTCQVGDSRPRQRHERTSQGSTGLDGSSSTRATWRRVTLAGLFVTRERALARLHNENAIRKAIEREEFRVFFQPEIAIDNEHIIGMEALVRWQHAERGPLGPGEFISLAEETGLIVPLGAWILRDACQRAIVWQRSRPADQPLTLRVNVSARQLAHDSLRPTVAEIIQETGIEPATLCLEVTESVLIEDPEESIRTLTELKKLGVKIAIDDFGTGYSSLEYLRRCPSTASRSTGRSCAVCPKTRRTWRSSTR